VVAVSFPVPTEVAQVLADNAASDTRKTTAVPSSAIRRTGRGSTRSAVDGRSISTTAGAKSTTRRDVDSAGKRSVQATGKTTKPIR